MSWDVATSEICRDIDPGADGIMLGMGVTKDCRIAASFTKQVPGALPSPTVIDFGVIVHWRVFRFSNNQLIIVDIMLGHYVVVQSPTGGKDPISDITVCGENNGNGSNSYRIVVFNDKYFR